MAKIKYFIQFIFILSFFLLFKIVRLRIASFVSGKFFQIIGPIFRSKEIIHSNIKKAFPTINEQDIKIITRSMWNNYGRVFAEYMFMKDFRINTSNEKIQIIGNEILEDIKKNNKKVIFVSGHFSNFELMAMQIEKVGIKLAAIYRPLNNKFLNLIMERIRKKYICKIQIKKGLGGLKELLRLSHEGYSTALMIDQRVSQGIKSNFFNSEAFTTTIPAQLVKKFKIPVVPIFIERYDNTKFKMTVHKPINFLEKDSIKDITDQLNKILEKMIISVPNHWIWSHNRWK